MKTKQEIAHLLSATFNVNKVWDFIESRPFYNKEYMPKFDTAKQIYDRWGPEEKKLYAKFKWKDKYKGRVHPREIENQRRQGNINKIAEVNKTKQELAELLSKETTTLAAQQGKDYNIVVGGSSLKDFYCGLDIRVSDWAAWYSKDDDGLHYRLMDAGKERATVYGRGEGSAVPIAKAMHSQNAKASGGENTKLTWQDYADIITKFWQAISKKKDELEKKEKKQPNQEKSQPKEVDIRVPDKYTIYVTPDKYTIFLWVQGDAWWMATQASNEWQLRASGKNLAQVSFKPSGDAKAFVKKIHEISKQKLGDKLTATPADHEKALKLWMDALQKVQKR